MRWVWLVISLAVFMTSCIGWGFFTERWMFQRKWPLWGNAILTIFSAFIWPVILLANEFYRGQQYIRQHPNEVNDAVGMVWAGMLFIVAPITLVISLSLILVGQAMARSKRSVA